MSGVNRTGENSVVHEAKKTKPAPSEATQAPKSADTAAPAMPADEVKVKSKTQLGDGVKLFDQPVNPKHDTSNVIYRSPKGDVEVSTYADDQGSYGFSFKTKF